MLMTGSTALDAERAFTRLVRSRRRAELARRLRRAAGGREQLPLFREPSPGEGSLSLRHGIHEIPLEAIRGTLEPSRATLFDRSFRPAASARSRWQRLWVAEQRGEVLPPISVVPVGDSYAIRDGHHRVSVARARGALTIDATIDVAPAG